MKVNNKGFSLIELMIVVGIVGVLATVAAPRFKSFQAKAKSSEAKVMLNHIVTLQESYALENGSRYLSVSDTSAAQAYGFNPTSGAVQCPSNGLNAAVQTNANSLGFQISPCDANSPLFAYNINANAAGSTFMLTANSGLGAFNRVSKSAAGPQKVSVDQTNTFTTQCDAVSGTGANCTAVAIAAP